jgi:hypothetical protein
MNTLRQAAQEYLNLRRSLGYKLYKAGKLLPPFVKFMEEHRASYVTTQLALGRPRRPTALDLPLPVWITECRGLAPRRSAQSRASGCGSQDGCADDTQCEVRQNSFDPPPPVDPSRAG